MKVKGFWPIWATVPEAVDGLTDPDFGWKCKAGGLQSVNNRLLPIIGVVERRMVLVVNSCLSVKANRGTIFAFG